jgi:hypothetical protein
MKTIFHADMLRSFSVIVSSVVVGFVGCAQLPPKKKCSGIASPDGALCAHIVSVGKHKAPFHEDRVDIRDAKEQLVASKSFKSPDGEHGRHVAKSQWTPDSQFFVFTTESSGGHSPWHWTPWFFDRQKKNFRLLDDATGPVIKPEMKVAAPDWVEVTVQGKPGDPSDIETGHLVKKRLSTVP